MGGGGGFVWFASSVLPPPGESECGSNVSELLFWARFCGLPCPLSAQSLSWVTRKRGRVVGISSWCGRVTRCGMPGPLDLRCSCRSTRRHMSRESPLVSSVL